MRDGRGTIINSSLAGFTAGMHRHSMENDKPIVLPSAEVVVPFKRHSRTQILLAFGVSAVSDVLSIALTFAPPVQWALDLATAAALFFILGRRGPLLIGLVTEAIPGMGIYPVWVLVVFSILVYDRIKRPAKA
jgi:hypothetical protein